MIVSVRNWTSIALPKRAMQVIHKITPRGPKTERPKQLGWMEAWERTLCSQANLLIEPYKED